MAFKDKIGIQHGLIRYSRIIRQIDYIKREEGHKNIDELENVVKRIATLKNEPDYNEYADIQEKQKIDTLETFCNNMLSNFEAQKANIDNLPDLFIPGMTVLKYKP